VRSEFKVGKEITHAGVKIQNKGEIRAEFRAIYDKKQYKKSPAVPSSNVHQRQEALRSIYDIVILK
jgi:hypothetical protein